MREHVNNASRRRDERLARVRKLSLWITGGAAAASLGMGTAFAHAIPGHTVSSRGSSTATGTGASGSRTGGTAHSSSPGSAGTGAEAALPARPAVITGTGSRRPRRLPLPRRRPRRP